MVRAILNRSHAPSLGGRLTLRASPGPATPPTRGVLHRSGDTLVGA